MSEMLRDKKGRSEDDVAQQDQTAHCCFFVFVSKDVLLRLSLVASILAEAFGFPSAC